MGWRILGSRERKEFIALLENQYGFTASFPYLIFRNTEGKHYILNQEGGDFIGEGLYLERVGVYLGQDLHGEFRCTIEGSQRIGPHATKGVITLTPTQRDVWMLGRDVALSTPEQEELAQRFFLVRCGEDWLGCGKAKNGILLNHVPKERYVGATFPDSEDEA